MLYSIVELVSTPEMKERMYNVRQELEKIIDWEYYVSQYTD